MAKASMFWLLHVGHLILPGGCDPRVYNSYRTEAALLHCRSSERAHPARANIKPARVPASPNQALPEERPPPEAKTCPDDSSQPVNQSNGRESSLPIDLNIASNARALHATRSRRHSDRHARGLRNQGKHIGFVVDSGCTYHIHPDVHDLINICSCSETVSG
eukprot:4616330-Pleurochrysis_carterae.AAC.1